MKVTISEALEMFARNETPEQYGKRLRRLRRLANERDTLEDAIEVLGDGDNRAEKKKIRLKKVRAEIQSLL